ncbi:metalloregulator ArsR/SmtB family transcription factor [Pseudoalteromonas mariniglutinosa]|uniref:metalloregulator ArsR/SmtB family transcription factor n=1 Tax=Pseudoalteromonas mariniglutinosa TaxID=206042 RepID=UPI00384AD4FB
MNPVQFYKCLADETRLRCLLLVHQEQELCVCELMVALNESQPKVSRHLAQLRKCQLLTDCRQGQWVFYRINNTLPAWAKQVIGDTSLHNSEFLAENQHNLNAMGDRPSRVNACCTTSAHS